MSMLQFGIYRATVVDINDPMNKGRLRVSPPNALGDQMAVWAPALITESLSSISVGDIVMVAFENGNSMYPIVLGLMERAVNNTQTYMEFNL